MEHIQGLHTEVSHPAPSIHISAKSLNRQRAPGADLCSIVEINTSIMVACMPACAAFLRFFTTKTDFFPALKARVFAALGSASTLMKRPSASLNTNNTGSQELPTSHVPATTGARYWRIKNVFSSAKNDPSPQITAKDQSDTLRMGRLNIIRTRGEDWRTLGIVNEEEDATRSSHETEQPRPARTHGWV